MVEAPPLWSHEQSRSVGEGLAEDSVGEEKKGVEGTGEGEGRKEGRSKEIAVAKAQ